jgi:L-aspartate semialdehyde sulfurtransferase ferredoxin
MTTKKILLRFPPSKAELPVVYHLVKDYDLMVNILRAAVSAEKDGFLALDISGSDEDIRRGLEYVRSANLKVDETTTGVTWSAERCSDCGNCIPHCPTHALHLVDSLHRKIAFEPGLCVECLSCLPNCPFGACTSVF